MLEKLGYLFFYSLGIGLVAGFIGDNLIYRVFSNTYYHEGTWKIGAIIGFGSSYISFLLIVLTNKYDQKK